MKVLKVEKKRKPLVVQLIKFVWDLIHLSVIGILFLVATFMVGTTIIIFVSMNKIPKLFSKKKVIS